MRTNESRLESISKFVLEIGEMLSHENHTLNTKTSVRVNCALGIVEQMLKGIDLEIAESVTKFYFPPNK